MSMLFCTFTVPRVVAKVAMALSPEITVYPVEAGETPESVAEWLYSRGRWTVTTHHKTLSPWDQTPPAVARRLLFLRGLVAGEWGSEVKR